MPAERGQAMRRFLAVLVLALAAAASAGAQEIVIGQSVALSGANADIGRDMRDGALAVFAKANAGNALGGRRVKLVTLDNANSRERALENTQQLLGQHGALVLFGYNSATNSVDSLPLVARSNVLFFAKASCTDSGTRSANTTATRCGKRPTTSRWLPLRSRSVPVARCRRSRRRRCSPSTTRCRHSSVRRAWPSSAARRSMRRPSMPC
ncbi:MAG: hypothetical protein E6H79_14645 [Betaproteobacteria bacterium]|nr:MAG: hypothetical protein E6H79_14645 [Betaproteobacteria bacterium]